MIEPKPFAEILGKFACFLCVKKVCLAENVWITLLVFLVTLLKGGG